MCTETCARGFKLFLPVFAAEGKRDNKIKKLLRWPQTTLFVHRLVHAVG